MEKIKQIYNIKKSSYSDINEHLETIFKFSQDCSHITEMGVRNVTSTWPMLLAAPQKLVSYDLYFSEEVKKVIELSIEYNLNYEFIVQDVLGTEIENTELLFIDTLHTYNQLTLELHAHSNKVSKYIILHDTITFGLVDEPIYTQASNIVKNVKVHKQGLMRAVEDFLLTPKGQKWEIFKTYKNNNGLTILKAKNYNPPIDIKRYIEDNTNKWNSWYKNLSSVPSEFYYGNTITYQKAANFLKPCQTVEDWGVGAGGFLLYRPDAIGVDGSTTAFAQKQNVDLKHYTSFCDGINIRHVLEHNYSWEDILKNAITSAKTRVAITVFTPFSETEETIEITHNLIHGVDVPDLSLSRNKFIEIIYSARPKRVHHESLKTQTGYGMEEIFLIELL